MTGASSGIGRAIALAFADRRASVVLASRRQEELEAVAREIEGRGGQALVIPTDVTSDAQVQALIDKTVAQWERIDIVVANAGQYVQAVTTDTTMEIIARSIDVNFYGAVRVALAAMPHMVERGSGHLVLISSVDGKKGLPTDLPYAAAKFALVGFGDVARQELREHGIEVTTVLPGRVDTPLIDHLEVPLISKPISPEKVARAVIRAVNRKRAEIVVPAFNALLIWTNTLSPRLADLAVRVLRLKGVRRNGW